MSARRRIVSRRIHHSSTISFTAFTIIIALSLLSDIPKPSAFLSTTISSTSRKYGNSQARLWHPDPVIAAASHRRLLWAFGLQTSSAPPDQKPKIPTRLFMNSRESGTEISATNHLEFELIPSISLIEEEEWNSCLAPDGSSSPFMEHAWLRCLEESGCASPPTGWVPQHVAFYLVQNDNDNDTSEGDRIWKSDMDNKKSDESGDSTLEDTANGGSAQRQEPRRRAGFVILYLKNHSMGEFIFDDGWSEAAMSSGIRYYPKLLGAVPFTPAAGTRILFHPFVWDTFSTHEISQMRGTIKGFLKRLAISNTISSVHINFSTDDEATDLSGPLPFTVATTSQEQEQLQLQLEDDQEHVTSGVSEGDRNGLGRQVRHVWRRFVESPATTKEKDDFLRRTSLQYHWHNCNINNGGRPYQSFDEYLDCFKSKRRITIRRERRKVLDDEDLRIDAIVGKDILQVPGLIERMFEIYLSTIEKMYWGRQYLTKEFFQMLGSSSFIDNLCFLCARARSTGEILRAEDVFAGTFNIIKNGVFYGRYWGCLAGREVKNLHFETCYWSAIEFCIRQGIKRMEPGAGGGEKLSCPPWLTSFSCPFATRKWARGFNPALIHSSHYICNVDLRNAVEQFLQYETENNVELTEYLTSRSSVAGGSTNERSSNSAIAAGAKTELKRPLQ